MARTSAMRLTAVSLLLAAQLLTIQGGSLPNDLGFHVANVSCNDDISVCLSCKTERFIVSADLQIFEYSKQSNMIQITILNSKHTARWLFSQEDPSDTFRFCHLWSTQKNDPLSVAFKGEICMTNDFSGLSLPMDGCATPLALISKIGSSQDNRFHGQKTMYCVNQ